MRCGAGVGAAAAASRACPAAGCCREDAAGARRLLLPPPDAGERLREERGSEERVLEEQHRHRRGCRPGRMGPRGRAGRGGGPGPREPMPGPGWGGRAAARAGQWPADDWARLRCADLPGPGTDWASPEREGDSRTARNSTTMWGFFTMGGWLPSSALFSSYWSLPSSTRLHRDEGAPCHAGLPRFTWLLRCAVSPSSSRLSSPHGLSYAGLLRSAQLLSYKMLLSICCSEGPWRLGFLSQVSGS